MDGWMDEWIDEQENGSMDGWTSKIVECTGGWVKRLMNGRMDGRMEG